MTIIAIPLYEGFDALDAVGPYGVLCHLPAATVSFVAAGTGPVLDGTGGCAITATATFDELPHPDVLVVPGTARPAAAAADTRLVGWIAAAHQTSRWTASVCTGAFLLGAAGVLHGRRATTHWAAMDRLAETGARPVAERYVVDDAVLTSAGVSAGIDMALHLAALLAGDDVAQAIQLGLEYDPRPPFTAGSPATAPEHVTRLVRARILADAA
jgi:transcriptional regulator GlxA family with amidase domain